VSAEPIEFRLAQLESSVEHLNGAYEQIDRRIGDLRSDVRGLDAKIDGVRDSLDRKIDNRFQWMIGIQVTSWLTTVSALATIFTLLLKH
jgi:predicted  nucleic acid-binding Zn-ribbon protein